MEPGISSFTVGTAELISEGFAVDIHPAAKIGEGI